jgi:processive 1,2-diacylglycerol beta-glucosyltransferase
VLILSASAGAGHVRAAEALLAAFSGHPRLAHGGSVAHWDMLKYTTKTFRYIYSKLYLSLANRAPGVLGYAYRWTDSPWGNDRSRMNFEKRNAGKFLKALVEYQPDIVVCTHFTPPFLVSWLYEQKKIHARPAVVITDFDVHAMWLARHYERYFCAIDEARVYLEKLGISPGRITVSGIPIDPVFAVAKDVTAARHELGLDPARFTVLVSAGGFGVGPIEGMIRELLTLKVPAQIVAIAGKGEALKSKLDKIASEIGKSARVTLTPVGFTRQMDLYMAAADILLSKPGGLTVSEAMARSLPMCIANPIPGQEERNSDQLLEAGVAIKCNNLPTLAYKLEKLVTAAPPGGLAAMRAKCRAFGKPHAAETIVKTLLGEF